MKNPVEYKTLLGFSFAFILFTAVGTVSHEFGHIIIAKFLGYETTLHYGSMNYDNSSLNDKISKIYNENKFEIENDTEFDKKAEYKSGFEKLNYDGLMITIGGPLQTTITGTIALIIIFWRRRAIIKDGLKTIDWLAVFLSLFWLREVFNLLMSVGSEIISPDGTWFSGDEKNISQGLALWYGTIPILLGVLGIAISFFIIFKIVPNKLRLTFILSGIFGGIFGFILWMYIIGPILIP